MQWWQQGECVVSRWCITTPQVSHGQPCLWLRSYTVSPSTRTRHTSFCMQFAPGRSYSFMRTAAVNVPFKSHAIGAFWSSHTGRVFHLDTRAELAKPWKLDTRNLGLQFPREIANTVSSNSTGIGHAAIFAEMAHSMLLCSLLADSHPISEIFFYVFSFRWFRFILACFDLNVATVITYVRFSCASQRMMADSITPEVVCVWTLFSACGNSTDTPSGGRSFQHLGSVWEQLRSARVVSAHLTTSLITGCHTLTNGYC